MNKAKKIILTLTFLFFTLFLLTFSYCKYEVEKAIKWCEKGNITSWMYKNREKWQ